VKGETAVLSKSIRQTREERGRGTWGAFWLSLWLTLFLFGGQAHAEDPVRIPAGSFSMGSPDGEPDERPVHAVHVDSFYLDRYLVTNADYARFLNLFGNQKEAGEKWLDNEGPVASFLCKVQKKNGLFIPKRGYENHPVVKVSWYGARAYARWLGKRLPTEAEWEKAARGNLEGKKYVYGDAISLAQANVGGFHATTPVGSYPPNGFGLYDMVASVWQWCSDWYDPEYYSRSPERNPHGPESGSEKVLRGGSWFHKDSWRVAVRTSDDPNSRSFCFVTGFRCAKDADK
jgi:formylglycine-generating enzyme required for sulfatase activity